MNGTSTILLAEDNPADVFLVKEAWRECGLPGRFHVVPDGERALEYLQGRGDYAGAPRPHLVILDLNLPLLSGQEVLHALRETPALADVPVAILTTSRRDEDRDLCARYGLDPCAYFIKPTDYADLVEVARRIASLANGELSRGA